MTDDDGVEYRQVLFREMAVEYGVDPGGQPPPVVRRAVYDLGPSVMAVAERAAGEPESLRWLSLGLAYWSQQVFDAAVLGEQELERWSEGLTPGAARSD